MNTKLKILFISGVTPDYVLQQKCGDSRVFGATGDFLEDMAMSGAEILLRILGVAVFMSLLGVLGYLAGNGFTH